MAASRQRTSRTSLVAEHGLHEPSGHDGHAPGEWCMRMPPRDQFLLTASGLNCHPFSRVSATFAVFMLTASISGRRSGSPWPILSLCPATTTPKRRMMAARASSGRCRRPRELRFERGDNNLGVPGANGGGGTAALPRRAGPQGSNRVAHAGIRTRCTPRSSRHNVTPRHFVLPVPAYALRRTMRWPPHVTAARPYGRNARTRQAPHTPLQWT
jgi:hypothetical protein